MMTRRSVLFGAEALVASTHRAPPVASWKGDRYTRRALDFIPAPLRPAVLAGVPTVDTRPYLQSALDHIGQHGGGRLVLEGLAAVAPRDARDLILRVSSNTELVGLTPADGIIVADNAGDYRAVLGPSSANQGIVLRDFTLHQNASGNRTCHVTPNVPARCLVAVLFVDYPTRALTIDGVRFLEAPGVNTVAVNTDGTGAGAADITVRNIRHEFLRGASSSRYDNSSVYLIGSGLRVERNTYVNRGVLGDAVTAEELHGRNINASGASVAGYRYVAILVSELTPTGAPNNIRYIDFRADRCRSGPALYSVTGAGLNGVEVGPGALNLVPALYPNMTDFAIGVGFWYEVGGGVSGDLSNIWFHDISINTPFGSAAPARINPESAHVFLQAMGRFRNVIVENVVSHNAPDIGVSVFSHSSHAPENVIVRHVQAIDPGRNERSPLRFGFLWRGEAGPGCALSDCQVIDTLGYSPQGFELRFIRPPSSLQTRGLSTTSTRPHPSPQIVLPHR